MPSRNVLVFNYLLAYWHANTHRHTQEQNENNICFPQLSSRAVKYNYTLPTFFTSSSCFVSFLHVSLFSVSLLSQFMIHVLYIYFLCPLQQVINPCPSKSFHCFLSFEFCLKHQQSVWTLELLKTSSSSSSSFIDRTQRYNKTGFVSKIVQNT